MSESSNLPFGGGATNPILNINGQFVLNRTDMATPFSDDEFSQCLTAVLNGTAVAINLLQGTSARQLQLVSRGNTGILKFSYAREDKIETWTVSDSVPHTITHTEFDVDNSATPKFNSGTLIAEFWLNGQNYEIYSPVEYVNSAENQEFVYIIADSNEHILFGIRKDGSVDWIKGIPAPIKAEFDQIINRINTIDSTVTALGQICSHIHITSNEEFVYAVADENDTFLFGITKDGSVSWSKGLPSWLESRLNALEVAVPNKVDKIVGKSLIDSTFASGVSVVSNEEFLMAVTDSNGAFLVGSRKDGTFDWVKGIPQVLQIALSGLQADINGKVDKVVGKSLIDEHYLGVDTGDVAGIADMDAFMRAFEQQLDFAAAEYVTVFANENDRYNRKNYTDPFMSLFCDDCIARGMDINDGGAHYPSAHGAGCMGIGTVADSLAAIEKCVFNEKRFTLTELRDAMAADFKGYETLQAHLIAAPKYGNDDDFVDKYAVWYVNYLDKIFSRYRTPDGGPYYTAIASNTASVYAGMSIGATPDGRHARVPLSDAASPTYGMDQSGTTAVFLSLSKPDYKLVSCGTVLNQKYTEDMLQKPENRAALLAALKVYFARGGQEVQINCVSRETLKDAMEHPEKYAGLVVRVSGFSAYFTKLDRAVQEDILHRTEHSEMNS